LQLFCPYISTLMLVKTFDGAVVPQVGDKTYEGSNG